MPELRKHCRLWEAEGKTLLQGTLQRSAVIRTHMCARITFPSVLEHGQTKCAGAWTAQSSMHFQVPELWYCTCGRIEYTAHLLKMGTSEAATQQPNMR